ncbi:MAG: hypothetical protein RJA81_1927 [Planctomycetota bacterium]|jgi:putative endonuclease
MSQNRKPRQIHDFRRFNNTTVICLKRWLVRFLTSRVAPVPLSSPPDRSRVREYARWLGNEGERYACWWLRRHRGMVVLQINYRHGHHEMDIIAKDGEVTVFVEVRTVSSDHLQRPSESVTPAKQRNVHECALAWRSQSAHYGHWRMDIIGIVWPDPMQQPTRVEHWIKAF